MANACYFIFLLRCRRKLTTRRQHCSCRGEKVYLRLPTPLHHARRCHSMINSWALRRLRTLFADEVDTAVNQRHPLNLSSDALRLQTLRVATLFIAATSQTLCRDLVAEPVDRRYTSLDIYATSANNARSRTHAWT